MLIDEDPLIQRIEDILDGGNRIYLCVEWSRTIYEVEISRWGLDEFLRYSVKVGDGETAVVYLRGMPVGATWIECPHPNIERGWWRLSPCSVEFLEGVLGACLDAVWSK